MADQYVRRMHGALFSTPVARQEIFPAAAGQALGAAGNDPLWSAWVDVALPAVITVENLIVGFTLDTISATCIAVVDIGITLSLGVIYATAAAVTAGGAAVIAGAHRAVARVHYLIVGAAGYTTLPVIPLLVPVQVPAGIGIIARWQTVAGAETANITVTCIQNL